jgi:hypothetical protein
VLTLPLAAQSAHALLVAKLAEVDALLEAGGAVSAPSAGDAAVSATLSRLDALAGSLSANEAARGGGLEAEDAAAVATLRAQLAQTQATLLRVRSERASSYDLKQEEYDGYADEVGLRASVWTPLGPLPPSLASLLPRPRPRRPPPPPLSRSALARRFALAALTAVAAAAQAPAVLALARALVGMAADVFLPIDAWSRLRASAPELASALRAAQRAFDASAPPAAEALAETTRRWLQACGAACARAAEEARPAALRARARLRAAGLARFAAKSRRAAAERSAALDREKLFRGWAAFSQNIDQGEEAEPSPSPAAPDAETEAAAEAAAAADAAAAARRERAAAEARERYKSWARSPEEDGASTAATAAAARAAAGAPAGGAPRSPRGEVERLLHLRARPLPREGPARDARFREVLRLRASAAPADVARAFRRLSGRVHPDKCSHPGASDAQALLSAARDGLLRGYAPPPTPAPGDTSESGDEAPSAWEGEPETDRERPDDGFAL